MKKACAVLIALMLAGCHCDLKAQGTNPPSPAATNGVPLAWKIVQMEGTVQVRNTATDAWANPQLNQVLPSGASVHTGADGKAVLKAEDTAAVTLQLNSTFEIGALTRNGDTTKAETKALSGKALFLVNKLKTQDSSFKVETPTAIVGVRGTAFAVKVADDTESSRVAVYHGEVGVQGKGAEPGLVIVKEKMGTNVVRNKPPTPPEALAEAEAAEWNKLKSEIQNSTPMASLVPAIGGMMEAHQIRSAEQDRDMAYAKTVTKGSKKADQDFKVFEAALVQYFKDTGTVPTKEQGLKALLEDPKVQGWHGPYLGKETNLRDPFGRPYKWVVKKSPKGLDTYEVRSHGPDGIPNNEDDSAKVFNQSRLEKLASESKPGSP